MSKEPDSGAREPDDAGDGAFGPGGADAETGPEPDEDRALGLEAGDEPDEGPDEPTEGAPSDEAPDEAPGPEADELPGVVAAAERIYRDEPAKFWAAVVLIPLLVVGVGLAAAPGLVWDGFIWEHLWGPIVADATGQSVCSDAVGQWHPTPCQAGETVARSGYTPQSYAVYGPVLGLALLALIGFLRAFDFAVDGRFILGLSPLIVFGAMVRVMEDTRLFEAPVQYWFISPLIYFTLAGITIGALALGLLAERIRRTRGTEAALWTLAVPAVAFVALYVAVRATPSWAANFAFLPDPAIVTAFTLVGFGLAAVDTWSRDRVDPVVTAFAVGLVALLMVLYNSAWWVLAEPWSGVGVGRTFIADVLPATLLGALGITAAVTALMWFLSQKGGNWRTAGIFTSGVAIAMLFGHVLDAWATTIALKNPLGFALGAYSEKHPASNFLIQELGWPIWVLVKIALVLTIVYILDVEYKRDFKDRPELAGLLKLAILVLGLGPGIRDLGRITLGV